MSSAMIGAAMHEPVSGRRGARSMLAGSALIVSAALPGFLTASLAVRIDEDFPFGASALGVAVSVFYIVSMLTSVPAGHLVERVGPRRGIALAGVVTAVAGLLVATLAGSAIMLVAFLVVAGAGNAMAGPTVSALLRREVAVERQGLAFGIQQASAPAGALLAGLALPAVAIPFGWRWAFLAPAVLALFAAAAAPRHGAGEAPVPGDDAPGGGNRTPVRLLAVSAAFASAAGVGLVSFIVLYAVDTGLSEGEAGLLLAGVSLGAAVSRVGLGLLADRLRHDALRPVAAMLAASTVGYLLLVAGEPAPVIAGALLAGAVGWAWPGALTLAVVRLSPQAPAWAVGVMMTGLYAGAFGGPLILGLLAGRGAFEEAWLVCATLALLAAGTVVAARRLAGGRA